MNQGDMRSISRPFADLVLARNGTSLSLRISAVRERQWLQESPRTISVEEFRAAGKDLLHAHLIMLDSSIAGGPALAGDDVGKDTKLDLYPRLELQSTEDKGGILVRILHRTHLTHGPSYCGESLVVPFSLEGQLFADAILTAFDRCWDFRPTMISEAKAFVHLIRRRGAEEYWWCEWQPVSIPGLTWPGVTSWGEPRLVDREEMLERGLDVVMQTFREFPERVRAQNPMRDPSGFLIEARGLADQQQVIVYADKRTPKTGIAKIQVYNYTTWDATQEVALDPIDVPLSLPPVKFGRALLAALDLCTVEEPPGQITGADKVSG